MKADFNLILNKFKGYAMKKRSKKLNLEIIILGVLILTATTAISAFQNKSEFDDMVIAEVGSEEITYAGLQQAFRKNMNRKDVELSNVDRDSVMNFLDLYIKYRLKVQDAIGRGFENDSAVLADIGQNRKILAESYYYDKVLVDPNVEKYLKMRKWEMKIAIILVSFKSRGPNPDTSEAYEKANTALEKIKKGEQFGAVAKEYSDDQRTAENFGVVPTYITVGKVRRPIEEAIYSIEKEGGIYPRPVRTKDGYFIIKLIEKKPRVQVRVSQILISTSEKRDSSEAREKADSLLKLLKSGADFSRLAEENSDDPSSAIRGGDLGVWYSRSGGFDGSGRTLVFEDDLFNLEDGEISGIIGSPYGYHIIKRDTTRGFDPKAEREELRRLYKRLYFEMDKEAHLNKLKDEYGFKIVRVVFDKLLSSIDTTKTVLEEGWADEVPEDLLEKPIFNLLDNSTTCGEFIDMMNSRVELRALSTNRRGLTKAMDRIVNPMVFKEASKNLEEEYPDFAMLMQEFRDGILLFRVEALEVWDKLKFDSVLAKKYYDTTKNRYKTDPTFDIHEIYLLNDSLAKVVKKKLDEGADFEELAEKNTQRAGYREKKGAWGKVSTKESKLAQMLNEKNAKEGDIIGPVEYEKGYSIIRVNLYEPVRQKTFEEAISDFAPEFQDLMQKNLTEKWLSNVRNKYPVKIHEDNLNKIFN